MKLTHAQLALLRLWHAKDKARGNRLWRQPYALQWGTCKALHRMGLMEHIPMDGGRGEYMLTDAGVEAIGGGE